jgi:hypothetical protein
MVKKNHLIVSMGAIWRQVVCAVIVLLVLVEEKMPVAIWLPSQAYISSDQKNTWWWMLPISQRSAWIQLW